ncbi:hypothetical protein TWF788_000395 [Orbilia oligospora]|uniref:Uncharacterized protein n=1 Tax=Orbilia oligospora TaxID=2813651 RepID=A0A7C8U8Y2_ORBOL|nr:hypothetical protein TWF788_000395 [Orbilia oligospora]
MSRGWELAVVPIAVAVDGGDDEGGDVDEEETGGREPVARVSFWRFVARASSGLREGDGRGLCILLGIFHGVSRPRWSPTLSCTALTLTLLVVGYDNNNNDDDDDDDVDDDSNDDGDGDKDKDKAIKVMFSRRREFQTRIPPKTSYACKKKKKKKKKKRKKKRKMMMKQKVQTMKHKVDDGDDDGGDDVKGDRTDWLALD